MKKLLAMALALTLVLGLASPALADEVEVRLIEGELAETLPAEEAPQLKSIADESPEVQEFLRQMYEEGGMLQENTDYDLSYFEDDYDRLVYCDPTPTRTLYVNGVATDVELTAENGRTYADADALRQILGPDAVSTDQTGPIAIRATAEAAGWDVGWYSGWWSKQQEVQLWDKASFDGFLNEEFAPLNAFLAKAMAQSKDLLFSEKATAGHETITVDLKRFSTLDGDKDYKLTLAVDYTVQNGVMDMTFTFDLSQLLQLFDGKDLTAMTKAGGFTPTQLTSLLRAGKAELILDYNKGIMAYNIPLLTLFDEDMAGWQSQYVPGLDTAMGSFDELGEAAFASSFYAQMVTSAEYSGAEYAFEQYDQIVSLMTLFAGKDRFTTKNGTTTYSLTTADVNAALAALLARTAGVEEQELSGMRFFKACDLTYTLDNSGNVTMEAHIRSDMEGIAAATAAANGEDDYYYTYGAPTMMKWLLPTFDMDITASARGNQNRATQRLEIHWNNMGKLSMSATMTTQTAANAPRQVEDVTGLPEIAPWQELLRDMLGEA